MTDITENLNAKHDQLIFSLLKYRTKREAASKAGISESTMYRLLRDPVFKAAYRAALRDRFQDCTATLEKNSADSAQALVDMVADKNEDSSVRARAAMGVIDRAFQAQDTIAMEEEMDHLRATLAALKAAATAKTPAAPTPISVRSIVEIENELAEACRLRVAWMGEVGNNAHDIEESLRYNRPQSAAEEQRLLVLVRQLVEVDNAYREATEPPVEQ